MHEEEELHKKIKDVQEGLVQYFKLNDIDFPLAITSMYDLIDELHLAMKMTPEEVKNVCKLHFDGYQELYRRLRSEKKIR